MKSVKSKTLYLPAENRFKAISHPMQDVKTVFVPVLTILLCLFLKILYIIPYSLSLDIPLSPQQLSKFSISTYSRLLVLFKIHLIS